MCERPFAHTDITSREAAAQEFHFSKMNNIFLFGLKSHRSAGDAGLDDLWCPHEQEPKIAAALFLSSIHSSTLLQLRLFFSCFSWYFPNEEEEEGIDLLPGTQ